MSVYYNNVDTGRNSLGNEIANLCENNNLYPLNHLSFRNKYFQGNFTFRQKKKWVSQIDWAICSENILPLINDFFVINDLALPSNHAPIICNIQFRELSLRSLIDRSNLLGRYKNPNKKTVMIKSDRIDRNLFRNNLPPPDEIIVNSFMQENNNGPNYEILLKNIENCFYNTSKLSVKPRNIHEEIENNRWRKILATKDSRLLWQSINWKGDFENSKQKESEPTSKQFCEYFDKLLNSRQQQNITLFVPEHRYIYIPILDDPISYIEIENAIKKIKSNKSPGLDGIPPLVLKLLTDEWLCHITFLMNLVFEGFCPKPWIYSRFVTIHKKGNKLEPSNYRGISIMSLLDKLRDLIYADRFSLWYTPQKNRVGHK